MAVFRPRCGTGMAMGLDAVQLEIRHFTLKSLQVLPKIRTLMKIIALPPFLLLRCWCLQHEEGCLQGTAVYQGTRST